MYFFVDLVQRKSLLGVVGWFKDPMLCSVRRVRSIEADGLTNPDIGLFDDKRRRINKIR